MGALPVEGEDLEMEASLPRDECVAVHEAGHAVAMALSGTSIKHIIVYVDKLLSGAVVPSPQQAPVRKEFSGARLARNMVDAYAGGAAELRFTPYWFETAAVDLYGVRQLGRRLARSSGVAEDSYLRLAWEETCRMFLDERVWAATLQIAKDLWRQPYPNSGKRTMAGSRVQRLVHQHLPNGWDWPAMFEIPVAG